MSTEIRTYVQFFYPGSFFPEESQSYRIGSPTVADVLAVQPDSAWFAAEVTTRPWRLWHATGQPDKWLPIESPTPQIVKFRILVGELLTSADVEALPGDHHILLANMRGNGWDPICRTRLGNFQPAEDGDVVLTSKEVGAA